LREGESKSGPDGDGQTCSSTDRKGKTYRVTDIDTIKCEREMM